MDDYRREISTRYPTCFLFLVDQSGSMQGPFGRDRSVRKTDGVADAINKLLYDLVLRCAGGEAIKDRYHVGVLGYGREVKSALGGELSGQPVVPVSEIGNKPLRIEQRNKKSPDGAGGVIETVVKHPVWLEPTAADRAPTPMCKALKVAHTLIENFVESCSDSFPPIVINITDGKASDGDPEPHAEALRSLATSDGKVLLFNVHISSSYDDPIQFPVNENELSDEHARLLFRMSSQLPPLMIDRAQSMEMPLVTGARGFVFNADLVSVVQLLDIGTRVATS